MKQGYTHLLGDLFKNRREQGKLGLPVMSVTLNNGLVDRDSLERKTDTNLSPEKHLLIKKGDLAYNMMRMWQGASGVATHDGIVSPAYIVLSANEEIDSKFASYWFKTPRMIYLFWAYSYGLTKDRLRLYYKDFSKIPVSLPPLPEQQKIAKILSTWDQAIKQTEELIADKQKLKKGLMQQLLTGKRRFPHFTKPWKEIKLEKIGKVISGGTPETKNKNYWNGNTPWISSSDLSEGNLKSINKQKFITLEAIENSATNLIPKGSVLVVSRVGVGKVAINDCDLCTSQDFQSITIESNNVRTNYIAYQILRLVQLLLKYNQGTAIKGILKKDLLNLKLPIPSVVEQEQIALGLETIDTEIEKLWIILGQYKLQKTGLMQQLLTGKKRVRTEQPAKRVTEQLTMDFDQ